MSWNLPYSVVALLSIAPIEMCSVQSEREIIVGTDCDRVGCVHEINSGQIKLLDQFIHLFVVLQRHVTKKVQFVVLWQSRVGPKKNEFQP